MSFNSDVKSYTARIRACALANVVNDLIQIRARNNGRVPRDDYKRSISSLAEIGVEITMDAMYKRVAREEFNRLSNPQALHNFTPISEVVTEDSVAVESDITGESRGGRPTGSTADSKVDMKTRYKKCMNEITMNYEAEKMKYKALKKRLPKNYLKNLIEEKKKSFAINADINMDTIRTRVKQNCLTPAHPGTPSPLAAAEEALVQICIQMVNIRQPLTVSESLKLINDLIDSTEIQSKLQEFQNIRKLNSCAGSNGTVGKSYWRGFMRRHGHKIVSKRGERFASNRANWTTYENIEQMYDIIYDQMVEARVAVARDSPVFCDKHGNIVSKDKNREKQTPSK